MGKIFSFEEISEANNPSPSETFLPPSDEVSPSSSEEGISFEEMDKLNTPEDPISMEDALARSQ